MSASKLNKTKQKRPTNLLPNIFLVVEYNFSFYFFLNNPLQIPQRLLKPSNN